MSLLRALIPSWRFFDKVGTVFQLQLRVQNRGQAGPWVEAVQPPPRKWWNFLFNPFGNRVLALKALIDRFALESQESRKFESSRTYELVRHFVVCEARRRGLDGAVIQFRVLAVTDGQSDVLFSSEWHEAH